MAKKPRKVPAKVVQSNDRLRAEADRLEAKARRIHESPSMFPDRDHQVIRMLAKADGLRTAAGMCTEFYAFGGKR